MRRRIFMACIASVTALGASVAAPPARAQMIPLHDHRLDYVKATYQGVVDSSTTIPAPFASWDDANTALAEKYVPCDNPPPDFCLVGSADALAFQFSQFYPAGIQFSGGTSGSWGIPPQGSYSFVSNAGFTFRVDSTFVYDLFIDIDPGDWPSQGLVGGAVRLSEGAWPGTSLQYLESGVLQINGRLGPGTYTLEGWSSGGSDLEYFQGAVYSAQWTIQRVPDPIIPIEQQPQDHQLACGGVAVFSVGTAGPQSNYTFQWRRNLVPLVNGGNISGATTSTLVITSACFADAGDYDVVVTGIPPGGGSPPGTPVSEPSRLAHLGIVTAVTAVDSDPASEPPAAFAVRAASPNPFNGTTSVRYEAARPGRLKATVFNVAGAKVRTIADDVVSGAGSVTWDGQFRSGARAPAGIYFIRLELGGVRATRKVLLAE